MEYSLIGVIVGLIMGLTGAGGALISIPLFLNFLHVSLKSATVLSLTAVLLGTLLNLISNKKKPDKKIAFLFTFFGSMSNYASLPLKNLLPDWSIAFLLAVIGIYSLFSIWKPLTPTKKANPGIMKTILTGLFLGVTTTLTGLGGGVLLVPILKSSFGKPFEEALPTSLLTIFLISLISLALQFGIIIQTMGLMEFALLSVGSLISALLLKALLKKISTGKADLLRKSVFSIVIFYSVGTILLKSL